jgi:hypothetical protein
VLGWFVFLFFIELLLRLFLNTVALILAMFRGQVVDCIEDEKGNKLIEEKNSILQNVKKEL